MQRIVMMLAVVLTLGLAACSDSPATAPAQPVVASVTVEPSELELVVGDSFRVEAVARAHDGAPVPGAILAWEPSPGAIVSLSGTGSARLVRAEAPGQTRVTVSSGGRTGRLDLTVVRQPPAAASVEIAPAGGELRVGGQLALTAVLKAADGEVLEGRPVAWSSTNPAVVQVIPGAAAGSAVLHGLGEGTAVVRATSAGVTGEAEYRVAAQPVPVASVELVGAEGVLQAGGLDTVRAVARAADGSVLADRRFEWSVTSQQALLAVEPLQDSSLAVVRGIAAGVAILTVRSEDARRDVVYTVSAAPAGKPVAHVFVRAQRAGLWVGFGRQFAAYTLAADGTALNDRPITWSSEDTLIATVDEHGMVRGRAPGTTRLIAESEGRRGYAELHVWQNTLVLNLSLTYDWWDGEIRLAEPVGEVQYDDAGETRTATLFALRGTFTLNRLDWTYERELVAEAWAVVGGVNRKVAEQRTTDRGTVAYRNQDGVATFEFSSTVTPGLRFAGVGRAPGELLVGMPLPGGVTRDLLFRLP